MMLKQGISFKRFMLTLFFIGAVMLIFSGCKPKVEVVPVESITISAAGNATTITTIGGTLQFSAVVLPADADDKSVTWSVQNGTGSATISVNGLLTAVSNGTVTVKATSKDDSTKMATKVITISNQDVVASSISITSAQDRAFIDEYQGTLQMSAVVLPANAANKNVVWSVENGTGSATISATGLLTAVTNGTVTVKATSAQNGAVFGTKTITLSNQDASVTSVELSAAGNATTITTFQGTLQFAVEVLPAIAANKAVVWSVENGTGSATISAAGLLTAASNGTVTVRVASVSNPTVHDSMVITISNQEVAVTSIELTSAGNLQVINTFGGTLQFNANVLPANANNKAVLWTVNNGSGSATISNTGLLTAVSNGTVTVVVTSVSNSSVSSTMVITISGQEVVATSITVSGLGDATIIDVNGGTLQMSA
ncbi:MAG: Ig-like domain-containing protein, partial [Acholeplasmataceae bacterium]|nr:Ig-like domain-containing protein [Acholeplasmataceae bacterium]